MKLWTLSLLILTAFSAAVASAQTRISDIDTRLNGEELLHEWSAHGFVELHRTQLFAFDQALAIVSGKHYLFPGVTFEPPTFPVDLRLGQGFMDPPEFPATMEAGQIATTYSLINSVVGQTLSDREVDELALRETGAPFAMVSSYADSRFIDSQRPFGPGDYKYLYPGLAPYPSLSNWGYFGAGLRGNFLFSEGFLLAGLGAIKQAETLGKYGSVWDNDFTSGNSPRGYVFAQMGFDYAANGQYIHDYFDRMLLAPPAIQSMLRTQYDLIRYLRKGALYYAGSDEEFRRRYDLLATRIQDAALADARARALLDVMRREEHDADVRKKNKEKEEKLKREYPGGPPQPDILPAGPSICVACYGTGPYISPISPPQIQPYQPVVPSLPHYWQSPSPYSPGPDDSGQGGGQEQPVVTVPTPD